MFTAQQTLADAQEFYADLKDRARRLGRDPDLVKILPGLVPLVGSTEAEARALEDELEGLIVDLARRDNLTVRQLIGRLGGGRGHRTFAGTPEQVADTIEEWSSAAAADGFNVMPAALPSGLETFVEHVIPILRKRGLFRSSPRSPPALQASQRGCRTAPLTQENGDVEVHHALAASVAVTTISGIPASARDTGQTRLASSA